MWTAPIKNEISYASDLLKLPSALPIKTVGCEGKNPLLHNVYQSIREVNTAKWGLFLAYRVLVSIKKGVSLGRFKAFLNMYKDEASLPYALTVDRVIIYNSNLNYQR